MYDLDTARGALGLLPQRGLETRGQRTCRLVYATLQENNTLAEFIHLHGDLEYDELPATTRELLCSVTVELVRAIHRNEVMTAPESPLALSVG